MTAQNSPPSALGAGRGAALPRQRKPLQPRPSERRGQAMKPGHKGITVVVPAAVHELLRRAAKKECTTMAVYLRDLIAWDLTSTPPSQRPQREETKTVDAGGKYPKPWENKA